MKKRIIIVFLLFFFAVCFTQANDTNESKANEAYNKDDYWSSYKLFNKAIYQDGVKTGTAVYKYAYSIEQVYDVDDAAKMYLYAYMLLKEQDPDHRYIVSAQNKMYRGYANLNDSITLSVQIFDRIVSKNIPFIQKVAVVITEMINTNDFAFNSVTKGFINFFSKELSESNLFKPIFELAWEKHNIDICYNLLQHETVLLSNETGEKAFFTALKSYDFFMAQEIAGYIGDTYLNFPEAETFIEDSIEYYDLAGLKELVEFGLSVPKSVSESLSDEDYFKYADLVDYYINTYLDVNKQLVQLEEEQKSEIEEIKVTDKDEFETTEQFEIRKKEAEQRENDILIKYNKKISDAKENYAALRQEYANIEWSIPCSLILGPYNADKQYFTITVSHPNVVSVQQLTKDILFFIPVSDAKMFKERNQIDILKIRAVYEPLKFSNSIGLTRFKIQSNDEKFNIQNFIAPPVVYNSKEMTLEIYDLINTEQKVFRVFKDNEVLDSNRVTDGIYVEKEDPSVISYTVRYESDSRGLDDVLANRIFVKYLSSVNIGSLVYVPAGSFQRDEDSANISVITRPFRMSATEITRAQFLAVMGTDPSDDTKSSGTNDPVQQTNWYHAIAFCNKLSLAEGLEPVYSVEVHGIPIDWNAFIYASIPTTSNVHWNDVYVNWRATGYRLPTDAEWMWAAMGASNDRSNGYNGTGVNTTGYKKAFAGSTGSNVMGDYAWNASNSKKKSHPVGTKLPNELGLYDMSGNVWEWTWDWYDEYPSGARTDYQGLHRSRSQYRVIRGGSWYIGAAYCTVAVRGYNFPYGQYSYIGFRVVRLLDTDIVIP